MESLSDRIEWILQNVRRPDGREWSAKGLSSAAGLSEGHVTMLRNGRMKSARPDTLEKLAQAAGVRYLWLLSGDGEPFSRSVSNDEPSPPSPSDDGRDFHEESRLGLLPTWPALVAAAKASAKAKRIEIPEWAWFAAAEVGALATSEPTSALALAAAQYCAEIVPPPPPGERDLAKFYSNMRRETARRIAETRTRKREAKAQE